MSYLQVKKYFFVPLHEFSPQTQLQNIYHHFFFQLSTEDNILNIYVGIAHPIITLISFVYVDRMLSNNECLPTE